MVETSKSNPMTRIPEGCMEGVRVAAFFGSRFDERLQLKQHVRGLCSLNSFKSFIFFIVLCSTFHFLEIKEKHLPPNKKENNTRKKS